MVFFGDCFSIVLGKGRGNNRRVGASNCQVHTVAECGGE